MGRLLICDVEFTPGGETYSYVADDESFNVGDMVIVCAGNDNHETVVRIVSKKSSCDVGLSVPAEKLKHILHHADEKERATFPKSKAPKAKKKSHPDYGTQETNSRPYETDGLQPDGSLVVSYADYGSEFFGGMDVEVIYKLDADDAEKLRIFLSKKYVGSIEAMLMEECGRNFMKKGPMELFEEAGVKYEKFVWIN